MAGGRIREDDIAAVRERNSIEDVIGEHVALKKAGAGSLKGLCPFHDERSPSFNVRPHVGRFHCFGCGEGGDVIEFVMKIDHVAFQDAVERLAARAGMELRYEDAAGGAVRRGEGTGRRQRLVEANAVAERFFRDQLMGSEGLPGRVLLDERGFDAAAADRFGVGYAPRTGDALFSHLRGRGFTEDELVTAGLVGRSATGRMYDRFRGRLIWPIRDVTGDTLGFGARRLFDDDRIEAKYLNTPETPLYRKGSVLYGVDLAKREIAKQRRVVVVEGYTDVMACHLSGVTTAVATCGTAFAEDHARLLRRLLGDTDTTGEVVFTFDGDAAGRRAALKAFDTDQQFVARTSVAVEPGGKDPCELRQAGGDEAVRALVEARVPLYEFVVRSVIADHDLDTDEGRMAALDAAAPVIAGIRDPGLRHRYAVNLDRWTGFLDEQFVVSRVARAARAGRGAPSQASGSARPAQDRRPAGPPHGQAQDRGHDPVIETERLALACTLQYPHLVAPDVEVLGDEAYQAPAHRAVHDAIRAVGGLADLTGAALVDRVADLVASSVVPLVTELAVLDLPASESELPRYVRSIVARVAEAEATRTVVDMTRRLSRMDPAADAETVREVSTRLHEARLRQIALRERAVGA